MHGIDRILIELTKKRCTEKSSKKIQISFYNFYYFQLLIFLHALEITLNNRTRQIFETVNFAYSKIERTKNKYFGAWSLENPKTLEKVCNFIFGGKFAPPPPFPLPFNLDNSEFLRFANEYLRSSHPTTSFNYI